MSTRVSSKGIVVALLLSVSIFALIACTGPQGDPGLPGNAALRVVPEILGRRGRRVILAWPAIRAIRVIPGKPVSRDRRGRRATPAQTPCRPRPR